MNSQYNNPYPQHGDKINKNSASHSRTIVRVLTLKFYRVYI